MYSFLLYGDSSLARYLASWYDAVPMLDIIGHKGSLSTLLFLSILCTFAVKQNLPAFEPAVG